MALDKALKCVENSYWRCLVEGCLAMAGAGFPPKVVVKVDLFGPDGVCLHTASMEWNVPASSFSS